MSIPLSATYWGKRADLLINSEVPQPCRTENVSLQQTVSRQASCPFLQNVQTHVTAAIEQSKCVKVWKANAKEATSNILFLCICKNANTGHGCYKCICITVRNSELTSPCCLYHFAGLSVMALRLKTNAAPPSSSPLDVFSSVSAGTESAANIRHLFISFTAEQRFI